LAEAPLLAVGFEKSELLTEAICRVPFLEKF